MGYQEGKTVSGAAVRRRFLENGRKAADRRGADGLKLTAGPTAATRRFRGGTKGHTNFRWRPRGHEPAAEADQARPREGRTPRPAAAEDARATTPRIQRRGRPDAVEGAARDPRTGSAVSEPPTPERQRPNSIDPDEGDHEGFGGPEEVRVRRPDVR